MATRFYVKCSPRVVGHTTGREPLGAFLCQRRMEGKTSAEFTGVATDVNEQEFGYVEGAGDDLSKFWEITQPFNVKRITEQEFIGACKLLYNPVQNPDFPAPPTFEEFMENHGIDMTDVDVLDCVKAYKTNLFKEVSKKHFYDDNDSIADLAKIIMLFSVWKDEDLTSAQIAARDSATAITKAIYTPDVCIDGINSMIEQLQSILVPYYEAKAELTAATTIEEANAIQYS